ncbi:MAG: arginine--tRNA ligase [Candidatus Moranbacteria bacterium CG23_combo_of_CG06-09_8_20_14_all_39_10]|nr:MAG: arginine--tRNA ligase [Candidatus Moranbacteria bacterium CG23_combo_of_CG06-09_8_20_14_all_39_10]
MIKELETIIKKAVLHAFELEEVDFSVEYPKDEKFGDYATNVALVLAKKVGKSPMEIAESLKSKVQTQQSLEFGKIEVAAPGYINFYLSEKYLQDKVAEINREKENFGTADKKTEKIMVEYSQPNTHKEFHIGHLRNVMIGSALIETLKKANYNVVSANYIGDTGSHIAKCLWGIEKFHAEENLDAIENKAEFLGKTYTEAVQAIEKNPEYEKDFKDLQNKFDQGNPDIMNLWKKTRQWSLDEFQSIYELLGAYFDVYFYESEEEISGKKIVPELLEKKVVEKSEGAIIANLEKYGLGVLVLVRKDGSALYGLKDIPLAIKKFEKFGIDTSIYLIDIRQSLYFKQLFKILELYGFHKKMVHIGYEFVALKGGEGMSSRKGNVILARKLIDSIVEEVRVKFPNSPDPLPIALGALKFTMLKYATSSKIEFDINESVKLDGVTGPYVQYAHARICSIVRKAQETITKAQDTNEADLSLLTHEKELSLIRELNKFPELVEELAQSYEVHKLPYYAIKLADKFHSFYNDCKVLDEDNLALTGARLNLINAVRIVLAETLRLIGVSAPDKM